MKTFNFKKAGLLIISGILTISTIINAQDNKPDRQSKKEAKKAQRAAEFQAIDSLLNFRAYVLEANYLKSKYGDVLPVTSNLNFIRVTGRTGVLQTGSETRMGSNNVGGVTAEGSLDNYRIDRDVKNQTFTVTFHLLSNIGNFDIIMHVNSIENAEATITGTTSGRLTWTGRLVPLDKSRVFKGLNTIM